MPLSQAKELVVVANQNLKEWVDTAGLIKVKPGSNGVPAAQRKAAPKPRKAAAQPRKRAPSE